MHDNWLTIVHIKDVRYLLIRWMEGRKDKGRIHVFKRKIDKGKSIKMTSK